MKENKPEAVPVGAAFDVMNDSGDGRSALGFFVRLGFPPFAHCHAQALFEEFLRCIYALPITPFKDQRESECNRFGLAFGG